MDYGKKNLKSMIRKRVYDNAAIKMLKNNTDNINKSFCALSPSPSLALLIGDCDVITFVENIQQGPGRETHKLMNKAINDDT